MKFTKLVIENYKSFQFATEIPFPVGADGKSIFLIGGMNGAGKTSIMEAVSFCLYGTKPEVIYKNINRKELARGNTSVSFELVVELDDGSELIVKRSWSGGVVNDAKAKDLEERLVVVQDGKRVSVQNKQMWQDFIRATIPPGLTQFFFFDGEKIQEWNEVKAELDAFKNQHQEAKQRFQVTFNAEPETRDSIREAEKARIQASNRLGQVENELKTLCEGVLPFAIAGRLFGDIRQQIDAERETVQYEAIRDNAAILARKIVRVVEEPEPIYREKLSAEKMAELEQRIFRLLQQGDSVNDSIKILNLSDRDAARVLQKMETLENSDVFLIQPLLEEKQELAVQVRQLEAALQPGIASDSEKELFDQLQAEMESCLTQMGRKTEQLRLLEDEILALEKRIRDIELDVEKLYEKHHVSKEKADFIEECDAIANLLNQYTVRLRKNKVHLLQEKTFEMYRMLSSKTGLIKDILIDDKSYEIKMIDRNGHEIRKSSLAAGEKEVFALSLLWGLAQTSQLQLPILIDTPLSRLDSTHRDNIINHYFPNAGQQVIILSTDTEIDKDYYRKLQPYLSGAASLEFEPRQELTTVKQGYFWEQ
jgi:DNA sulfur modification protein DndD